MADKPKDQPEVDPKKLTEERIKDVEKNLDKGGKPHTHARERKD